MRYFLQNHKWYVFLFINIFISYVNAGTFHPSSILSHTCAMKMPGPRFNTTSMQLDGTEITKWPHTCSKTILPMISIYVRYVCMKLLTFDISRSSLTRLCRQNNSYNDRTSARFCIHERHPTSIRCLSWNLDRDISRPHCMHRYRHWRWHCCTS